MEALDQTSRNGIKSPSRSIILSLRIKFVENAPNIPIFIEKLHMSEMNHFNERHVANLCLKAKIHSILRCINIGF